MGCVGNDEYAKMIKEKAEEIGVETALEETNEAPTAKCAILLTNKNRSMVAHVGAACHFSIDFLEQNWDLLETIQIFYITVTIFCLLSPYESCKFYLFL